MFTHRTLLVSDIVDSTELNDRVGDENMRALWSAHDQLTRRLLRRWRGTEVGRSDGFVILFAEPSDAMGFAAQYHRALSEQVTPIKARVGIHMGPVSLRSNTAEDRELGATPFEIDGVALPTAARISALATGGQTLATASVVAACNETHLDVQSHGYWRLKGLEEPVELFEIGDASSPFRPPDDTPKGYRVVQAGDAWITVHQVPNNVPAERDRFIGRFEELKSLARAFERGARLTTLLGAGGVGKTRLAVNYARTRLGDYPGGAWFCDLRAVRTVNDILFAVAQSLQIELQSGDPVERIGNAIAGRRHCLLILDNFEHVASFAEDTVGKWLELAPDARFIATSRQVLGIVGEHAMLVQPLSHDDAERMFRERVTAFALSDQWERSDDDALHPLLELLDRLPLAIELAAARTRVMTPSMLLQRMSERFKLLSVSGGRPHNQLTLRKTLDWSWDLLPPAQQAALAQLSVFEGGVTLQAAEVVVSIVSSDTPAWVPDIMQALVEKSLLRRVDARRFDMLRSVHDYAEERLASANPTATYARHWQYFAGLTEPDATAQSGIEGENIVTACRRAASSDAVSAIALLRNAWSVLRLKGPFVAAVELGESVEAPMSADDPRTAVVHRIIGAALSLLGNASAARTRYASAIDIATKAGDFVTLAEAQCLLADLELARGAIDTAATLLGAAQSSPAAQTHPSVKFMSLNGRAKLALHQSQWHVARSAYGEALALAEALANRRWQGGVQGNLGMVARAEGRHDDALRHWRSGLALALEIGDHQWAGNTHCNLGLLLLELGHVHEAETHLNGALEIARTIGHRELEATTLCNLGLAAEAHADLPAARSAYTEGAAVAQALGNSRLEGQARGYLGVVTSSLGEHERALDELTRAETLLAPHADPSTMALVLLQAAICAAARGDGSEHERCLTTARVWIGQMSAIDPEVASTTLRAERAAAQLGARTPKGA